MTELHLIKHVARRFVAQRTYTSGIPRGPSPHTRGWSVFEPANRRDWNNFSTHAIIEDIKFENKLLLVAKNSDEADTFYTVAMRYYMPFTRKAWMDDHLRSGA